METKDLIKKIRRLEIKAKGLTKHIFSGEYNSAFKGRGMAFSEVRDYKIGDEVRTIDWNVTARYNSPHVKVFDEEREMTVMLLIDISGSQNFGTKDRSKRELASEIAALLAFAAVSNNDKVGAIFFSASIEKYIAPEKGSKHALRILHDLLEFNPKQSGTSIKNCLEFHRNTQKKRTITFVISDFNDANNFLDAFKLTAAYKGGKTISGYTPLQRFFLGYALGWMYSYRDESIASQIVTDVHAPAKQRVNGPMPNIPEFYEAFKVTPKNKLYLADSLRVQLW